MAGLTIRVYTYDATTKEMREVSAREWSVDTMPNLPLLDDRWPLCECYRCRGNGTPETDADLTGHQPHPNLTGWGYVVSAGQHPIRLYSRTVT